jgi:hypothetical protein
MTTKTQSLGVHEAQVLVLGSQIWAGAPWTRSTTTS